MLPFCLYNFGSHMSADKNVAHKSINSHNIIQRNLINKNHINNNNNQWASNHLTFSIIIIKDDDTNFLIVRSAKCCRLCLVLQR